MLANLYGYVMVYESYKHHSKYPFDNYRINVLQWGGVTFLWYSILPRGLLYIKQTVKLCQFGWLWAFLIYKPVTIQIGNVIGLYIYIYIYI